MMKKSVFPAILAVLILAGAFKCPLYAYIGIPCPSCGMTRAWKLFLAGNFADAFFMHPLFWTVPLFLLPQFRKKRVIIGALILLLTVYILRMALFFPHTEPMNYNYNSFLGGFLSEY